MPLKSHLLHLLWINYLQTFLFVCEDTVSICSLSPCHCVARLTWNSRESSCLCFQNAEIIGVCLHTGYRYFQKKMLYSSYICSHEWITSCIDLTILLEKDQHLGISNTLSHKVRCGRLSELIPSTVFISCIAFHLKTLRGSVRDFLRSDLSGNYYKTENTQPKANASLFRLSYWSYRNAWAHEETE